MLENFGEGWCSRLLWGVVLFVNFTLLSYDKTCYQNLKMLIKVEALALCSSLSLFCELWALCDAVLKCLAVVQFHDFIPWWWQRSWAMLHAPPKNVGCCFQHPTTAMYPYPYNMSTPVCLFFTQLSLCLMHFFKSIAANEICASLQQFPDIITILGYPQELG